MNRLDLFDGGFPLATETLDFLQGQSQMAATLTALGGSDTYILSGVTTQGSNVTNGMIVYKGEILPFTGGPIQSNVTIIEDKEQVTYQTDQDGDGLGDEKSAYVRRRAEFGTSGVETFNFSELKPFIQGVVNQMFTTFFKDVRLPYVGAIEDIPEGWELCEILSGHFPVIYDPSNSDYNVIGKTGGDNTRTLTQAQIPPHDHTGSTSTNGNHGHTGGTSTAGNHTHSGGTSSAGNHRHTGSTSTNGHHTHGIPNDYNLTPNRPDTSVREWGGHTGGIDQYVNTLGAGSHNHSFTSNYAGTHSHSISVNPAGNHTHSITTNVTGNHSHTFKTQKTGSGQAFDNRPKYKVIALIKYVGLDPIS
ncbi:hypothetical protein [Tenacibaculum jejuense]|uniref:Phage tail collar domain-containing protein n=1 Tax=Tenacibaculum jejuense TaxID=584609 RepID=A0A238UD85_9FLAO|nr:hypothetical protein [Tenacibaculum jejuense]SNR16548.1 protein of unknown function [Tenacibaculum jejuense]